MVNGEFHRVTCHDLKRMCISAGLPFPEEEIDALIESCPKDDDQKMSFEDFIVHLEKSQMALIEGKDSRTEEQPHHVKDEDHAFVPASSTPPPPQPEEEDDYKFVPASSAPFQDPPAAVAPWEGGISEQAIIEHYQRENEELKSTIKTLNERLEPGTGTSSNSREPVSTHFKPVLPQIQSNEKEHPSEAPPVVPAASRHTSNVLPENPPKEVLPKIQTDMFGQAHQEPKVYGRRKYKEVNAPIEDIFGNTVQCEPASAVASQPVSAVQRPQPQIDHSLLENIRACMDRNNKRALDDVTSTIDRWNGGAMMTRRMLQKILKHSGLRLPNETVRILFDRLDVFTDGTVELDQFFNVFKDAENSVPQLGADPGQVSRNRRAEMQNRAAPWATM